MALMLTGIRILTLGYLIPTLKTPAAYRGGGHQVRQASLTELAPSQSIQGLPSVPVPPVPCSGIIEPLALGILITKPSQAHGLC